MGRQVANLLFFARGSRDIGNVICFACLVELGLLWEFL